MREYHLNYKIKIMICIECEYCNHQYYYYDEFKMERRNELNDRIQDKKFRWLKPVACPACRYIQSYMIHQVRNKFSSKLEKPIKIILFILFLIADIAFAICRDIKLLLNYKYILCTLFLAVVLSFMGAAYFSEIISLFYKPNRGRKSKRKNLPSIFEICVEDLRSKKFL